MKLIKKIYTSTNCDISFIYKVEIDGVLTNQVFRLESNNRASVVDPAKQAAIEGSKYFKNGMLKVLSESEATELEIQEYYKQSRKERRVVELATTRKDIADKVQETAQIGIVTKTEKSVEEEINEELEKAESLDSGIPEDGAPETDESKDPDNDESKTVVEEVLGEKVDTAKTDKIYSLVEQWQEAKEILRKEYNVAFQKLNTPANILKMAAELGVEFPNLHA